MKYQNENLTTFKVWYKNLLVGTLQKTKYLWRFQYSEDFIKQDKIQPIIEFKNKTHIYYSNVLFQFFKSRIPSRSNLPKEESTQDELTLLQKYGTRTINNPYVVCKINQA